MASPTRDQHEGISVLSRDSSLAEEPGDPRDGTLRWKQDCDDQIAELERQQADDRRLRPPAMVRSGARRGQIGLQRYSQDWETACEQRCSPLLSNRSRSEMTKANGSHALAAEQTPTPTDPTTYTREDVFRVETSWKSVLDRS